MDKEYARKYADLEKNHWWFLARAKIISTILAHYLPGQKLNILNIGVAGGETSRWLAQFGEVTSVENDSLFIELYKKSGRPIVEASITSLPFNNSSFDLVCAFDVVEHVENDRQALVEMQRVCRKGGFVCITVPAIRRLWSGHDVVNRHYRRYQISDFRLLGSGMKNIYISYFNTILFLPVWMARCWPGRKKDSPKSDFETFKTNSFYNRVLKAVFGFESTLLPKVKFPFGVSLFGLWKM